MRVAPDYRIIHEINGRACRQSEQLRKIARCQRKVGDGARIKRASQRRAVSLDKRRGVVDRNRVRRNSRDGQYGIDRCGFSDANRNGFRVEDVEAVGFDANTINAGRKKSDGEIARCVGCYCALFAGSLIADCNIRANDERVRLVFDRSGDASCGLGLREDG